VPIGRVSAAAASLLLRAPDIDTVVTPKLGLNYAPLAGVTLKGSWGRSFRAPTFLQLDIAGALGLGITGIVFTFFIVDLLDNTGTLLEQPGDRVAAARDVIEQARPDGQHLLEIPLAGSRLRDQVTSAVQVLQLAP